MKTPCVIKYKGKNFVCYNLTSLGAAKLLNVDGTKFSGTPSVDKLEFLRPLETKEFNNSKYFQTINGIFSATTGNKITHLKIIEMFK